MQTSQFEPLARRYTGARAEDYDARRIGTPKWLAEQAAVERLLAALPPGTSLVDIPVGTGRFLPLYARFGIRATGMDISDDMLDRARAQQTPFPLRVGDIRRIDAGDGEYDCALCVRFLNWVELEGLRTAIMELARVSRRHVIVSIRSCPARSAGAAIYRQLRALLAQKPRPEGQLVIHERRHVEDTFRRARLHVESASLVEASPGRSEYHLYHLTKR